MQLFADLDNDGQIDDLVGTQVTDAHGGYLFTNLNPDVYKVQVDPNTVPAGLTQTVNPVLAGSDFGNQSQPYMITLGPGDENLTADFGYNWNTDNEVNNNTGIAALGDRVWIDADADGAQDPNEVGLEGVELKLITAGPDNLFGTSDDVVGATTTTDANGNYLFDNLAPGAYVVMVNTATLPPGYVQTGDPDHFGTTGLNDQMTTKPVVLAPGDVFINADFGYLPPANADNAVGDTVWFDADADGVYEPGDGEYGIPGVTVALIHDTNGNGVIDAGEPIIGTDTTDANGVYGFDGLPDGKYIVLVNDTDHVLGELTQSGDPDGVLDNRSSVDLDSAGVSAVGVIDLLQDFGYTPIGHDTGEGLIGDTVFLDVNNNGQPDAGEGIEGVVVKLLDSNGILIATTTTDENGNYSFGNLDPVATYQVMVDTTTLPPGLTNTVDPDGTTDSMSIVNLGAPGSDGVNDTDGIDNGINLGQDFGYVPVAPQVPGTIGNLVWLDSNADGVFDLDGADNILGTDDDEPPIAGVTLDLYSDTNGNGRVDPGEPLVASTITDANGNYLFTNLPTADNGVGAPGADYVVNVTDENGVLFGHWHSLGATGLNDNSQLDPYAVSISEAAPDNLTADFGYYIEPAALGNFVWDDLDGNGRQDAGEPGIENVLVELQINYPNGVIVTLTDANGFYRFGNLLLDEDFNMGSGTETPTALAPAYVISVTDPAGYTRTIVDESIISTDKNDSDDHDGVAAKPIQGLTDVSAQPDPNNEQTIASYDFGYFVSQPTIAIDKFTRVDTNPIDIEKLVRVEGPPIQGDICDVLGKPVSLTFQYIPSTEFNPLQPSGKAVELVNVGIDGDDTAYIVVAKNSDPNNLGEIFFQGDVNVNDTFTAAGAFGSNTYFFIFDVRLPHLLFGPDHLGSAAAQRDPGGVQRWNSRRQHRGTRFRTRIERR